MMPVVEGGGSAAGVSREPVYLDAEQLARLHLHLYRVLGELDRVCEELGIRYFLIAGSVLGAVRHEGIIPWDDDIDVGLLRRDYDKLLRLGPALFGNGCYLQTPAAVPLNWGEHAKLRLDGTVYVEYVEDLRMPHRGVFVDIYPLDYLPDRALARRAHYALCRALHVCVFLRCAHTPPRRGGLRGLVRLGLAGALLLVPDAVLKRLRERVFGWLGDHPTGHIAVITSIYGVKEIFASRVFASAIPMRLGPLKVPVPQGWQEYLSQVYGDFMTLPPLEDRRQHHPVLVFRL